MRAKHKSSFVVLLIVLLVLLGNTLHSRTAADRYPDGYKKAVELFDKGLFSSAGKEFESLLLSTGSEKKALIADIEAYLTLIAIERGTPDFEARYNNMESNFSLTTLMSEIRLRFGSTLFDKEDYNGAFKIFALIKPGDLSKNQLNEFYFKSAYAHFRTGNTTEALSMFNRVSGAGYNVYTNPSIYYSAHVHYIRRDFRKAVELFMKIESDPRFSLLSRYYILESRFMLKDYNYVTIQGESLYPQLSGELKMKSARIISEAFFALDNTDRAKFYFEKYSTQSSNLSRKDIYYSGILAYAQKSYNEAIELLRQVISENDTLTQNAAYHLGRCYIEIKNKFEALGSFRLASEGSFDLSIKEDAMFNYAKLSFDLNSDITVFRRYLDTFSPPQEKFNEIQNYIATSYLLKQDYKSAIDILRTIRNPSVKDYTNLQKATFLRGMQLINLGAFRDAIPVFELSLSNGSYNNNLYNVTNFWLAEAYFRNNQFQRSIDINYSLATQNNNFRGNREYPTSYYNLAYGYFKTGNFEQAANWFNRYLNLPKGDILYPDEARARLGDCLFMQRKYNDAIEAFNQVSSRNTSIKHYSVYQTSVAYGLLGDDKKKSSLLKTLIGSGVNSTLHPEILYELGRTLIQTGEDREAAIYLTELRDKFSTSHFHTKALLELGLIHLNRGENERAISYYKEILTNNPQSPEAQSAISGLENIYQDLGRAEEFLRYIDALGLSQTRTVSERELIVFNSAEKQFLSGNYAGAINSLNSFLKSYPTGGKSAQAWFYLGESYSKTGKPELALDAFLKVMEIGEESFTELATLNYSRISYQLENYRQAAKGYSSLSRIALLENNKIEARIGLMNSYFMDRQFQNAIAEAEQASKLTISEQERVRIKYITGKSYYLLGERQKATPYLNDLAKNKISPEGAESTYLIISDAFDKGDFQKVERDVYAFADSRTPQSYWLAKAYILLGDSFAERDNWSQAEATFNSILESYKPKEKDDIEEQLRMRLSKIQEKKNNQL
ncbi:MAG: tetratricopeptide repeat protein [Bacteroidales bacterium]|nr:tetratricopeptide repeat protein [Bacteroidales bacterium]